MPEITLLQKVHDGISLEDIEDFLKSLCEGLNVQIAAMKAEINKWLTVRISGEDERAATHFLGQKIGLAPINMKNIKPFSILKGVVESSRAIKTKLIVDVGVFSPKIVYASIDLDRLQAQLVDGKKFAIERIVQLFGLENGFPIEIRIAEINESLLKAEIAEKQLELYKNWIRSSIDRLIVIGVFFKEVEEAVEGARLDRDIIGVETIGFMEHAVVCKLGTDAAGLVPKLGRRLPKAEFVFFSPRKILELVNREAF